MILTTKEYGQVYLELSFARDPVDVYINLGYKISNDQDLTDEEIERIQDIYSGELEYENYLRNCGA